MMKIRIGTRGSRLALWQAAYIEKKLALQGHKIETIIIKTKGDQIQNLGFDKMEGKGFFTSEIEDALLENRIDLAVHSLKDLPTTMNPELVLAGLSERANPADLLIIHPNAYDKTKPIKIKSGARVGTSSIRRKVQLSNFDSSLFLEDLRGNVPTRVQKVRERIVDGIIIAVAGIERLELDISDLCTQEFNPIEFIPAPAQGVNAYQTRTSDMELRKHIAQIHNNQVAECTNIERKILQHLDGGCQVPIGVYITKDTDGYHAYAMIGTEPGHPVLRIQYSQSTSVGMAEEIVNRLKS